MTKERSENKYPEIKKHAQKIRDEVNRKFSAREEKLRRDHDDTERGIEFYSALSQHDLHNIIADAGLGSRETGVDIFLRTGSMEHYREKGEWMRKNRIKLDLDEHKSNKNREKLGR